MTKKFILTATLGILFAFIGSAMADDKQMGYPSTEMAPGTYDADIVLKRFNIRTGDPIYRIIAQTVKKQKISGFFHKVYQGDFRYYEVPRTSIANLPADKEADPNFNYRGEIIVK